MWPVKVISFYLTIVCVAVFLPIVTQGQIRESEKKAVSGLEQVASPCPAAFKYDPREPGATKWFGVIMLSTNIKLVGFTLDIKLNKPVDLLGNWQGEVETEDNTRFSITSTTRKINPGAVVSLRIFVKYNYTMTAPNSSGSAPHIVSIKLNGRKICSIPPGAKIPTTTTQRPTTRYRIPPRATTHHSSTTDRPREPVNPVVSLQAPSGSNIYQPPMTNNNQRPNVASGSDECGKVHVQPQALITHGQGTERGQWPWHAAMYQNKGKDLTYICGASLIGRKTVVTAAHCVTTRPSDRAVDPDTLVLYFGKHHLLLWSDGGVQTKQVQQVIVHPTYNSSSFKSDLAVLTLKSAVDYTEFVRPVCLWESSKTSLKEVEGKDGSVVGWGFDETGKVSQELMLAKMPVVSQISCIRSYPEFFSHFTSDTTFCAGFRNGTSVCNGDSGGGMHFPFRQRDNTNTWFLRGLVSISPSRVEERVCDTSHYVIFTDLAQYLPWLKSHIKA